MADIQTTAVAAYAGMDGEAMHKKPAHSLKQQTGSIG